MAEQLIVEVDKRAELGKNASRRMRRRGTIPGVLYGADRPNLPIQINEKQIEQILRSQMGMNTVFQLQMAGTTQKRHVMIKDYQAHPVTRALLHADFLRISMDQKLQVRVPVELTGVAEGVKVQGGVLDHIRRELTIECLPQDIPDHIRVDVTHLTIGHPTRVSNLDLEEGVTVLDEPERVIAVVNAPRVEEEKPAEEVEEEAAEPEVIKKGKAEEAGAKEEGQEKKE